MRLLERAGASGLQWRSAGKCGDIDCIEEDVLALYANGVCGKRAGLVAGYARIHCHLRVVKSRIEGARGQFGDPQPRVQRGLVARHMGNDQGASVRRRPSPYHAWATTRTGLSGSMLPTISAFSSHLSMSLHGGLRVSPFALPRAVLDEAFGCHLDLADDLELGGVYYCHEPYPLPQAGLVGVRLHANAIEGLGATDSERPDLITVLNVEVYSTNLLDLGRLEWQLRAAFGDLFDVSEYVITARPPISAAQPVEVHWVRFAAARQRRGLPIADTPVLHCSLGLELSRSDQAALRAAIESLSVDSAAVLRNFETTQVDDDPIRLTLSFDSPSLLELGRYAQAVELGLGASVRVLGYAVSGDLLRTEVPPLPWTA